MNVMNRQEIIDYYQRQINKAESKIEVAGLEYQCRQHLKAFDNGESYNMYTEGEEPDCVGCH
jgi:hypothetical protein